MIEAICVLTGRNRYWTAFVSFTKKSLYCGNLDCGTVLLNRDGMVKIGMLTQLDGWVAKTLQQTSRSRF